MRIDHYLEFHAPVATSIVVAVSVFVLDEAERLLMIRRADNELYSLPGGPQQVGETISAAAVRQVKAGTGIDIEVTGLIGIYSDPEHVISYDTGEIRQEFAIAFRGRPLGGSPHPGTDSTEVLWVEQALLYELTIHPAVRLRIQHGFDASPSPFYA